MQTLLTGFNEPEPGSMMLHAWHWTENSDPETFDKDIIAYHCIICILEW